MNIKCWTKAWLNRKPKNIPMVFLTHQMCRCPCWQCRDPVPLSVHRPQGLSPDSGVKHVMFCSDKMSLDWNSLSTWNLWLWLTTPPRMGHVGRTHFTHSAVWNHDCRKRYKEQANTWSAKNIMKLLFDHWPHDYGSLTNTWPLSSCPWANTFSETLQWLYMSDWHQPKIQPASKDA